LRQILGGKTNWCGVLNFVSKFFAKILTKFEEGRFFMIEVKRKERETSENLIRRFSRRVQQSGVLVQARKSRFRKEDKTRREVREGAMYKARVKKVVDRLKKMGKFDEETFKNIKKKMVK